MEPTRLEFADLYVLHLDAGHDRNGNPRRAYALCHPHSGMLAAVTEGYAGSGAMGGFLDLVPFVSQDSAPRIVDRLSMRVGDTIPTTPAYIRQITGKEATARYRARNIVVYV